MKYWRGLRDRLSTHRIRRVFGMGVLLFVIILSGCQGGLRHESWPGMILVDTTLYVANLEHVQAVNSETGKVYWSFPPETEKAVSPFYSTPVFSEEYGSYGLLLIAGYKDQTVYALTLGESPTERPDELWRFSNAVGQYVGSGTLYDGLFIIGNGDGKVYAIRVDDGSLAWSYQTSDRIWATPVVVDDVVYVASLDHNLYALEVQTGQERWSLKMEGAMSATPIYADGSLWVGDFSSKLYRLNLESHNIEWTFTAEDWIWATPIMDGSTMYVVDVGGNVYAINAETNAVIWQRLGAIDDIVHGRPVLNEDGSRLYVAGYEKGIIHVINTENGSVVNTWTQKDAGRLPGDLLTDGERLYALPILVQDRVQAYDIFTGDRIWPQVVE
jgi:outer membrane protein assembly factor BamB